MYPGSRIVGIHGGVFVIERPLGLPGLFGQAFLAQRGNETSFEYVAVKVLRSDRPSSDRKRFFKEAETLERLRLIEQPQGLHYAVRLLDQSADDAPESFLVIELATGKNVLHDIVDRVVDWESDPPAEHLVLDIMLQFAKAMAVAHQAGICYDDMKLDNLFWNSERADEQGRPQPLRIIDWNVVSDAGDRGLSGDWARFGALLYQLLTGERIAVDRDGYRMSRQPQSSRLWPGIPYGLQRIIVRALHDQISRRYDRDEDLLADLQREQEALNTPDKLLISRARAALGRERYEEALTWLDRVIRRDPSNSEALLLRADAQLGTSRLHRDELAAARQLLLMDRPELSLANERLTSVRMVGGPVGAEARRLLTLIRVLRALPAAEVRRLNGEGLIATLLTAESLAGDQIQQAIQSLEMLARDYPQVADLRRLTAELQIRDYQARLHSTGDLTSQKMLVEGAQQALRQLEEAFTDSPDLRQMQNDLIEQQRMLDEQIRRLAIIATLYDQVVKQAAQVLERVASADHLEATRLCDQIEQDCERLYDRGPGLEIMRTAQTIRDYIRHVRSLLEARANLSSGDLARMVASQEYARYILANPPQVDVNNIPPELRAQFTNPGSPLHVLLSDLQRQIPRARQANDLYIQWLKQNSRPQAIESLRELVYDCQVERGKQGEDLRLLLQEAQSYVVQESSHRARAAYSGAEQDLQAALQALDPSLLRDVPRKLESATQAIQLAKDTAIAEDIANLQLRYTRALHQLKTAQPVIDRVHTFESLPDAQQQIRHLYRYWREVANLVKESDRAQQRMQELEEQITQEWDSRANELIARQKQSQAKATLNYTDDVEEHLQRMTDLRSTYKLLPADRIAPRLQEIQAGYDQLCERWQRQSQRERDQQDRIAEVQKKLAERDYEQSSGILDILEAEMLPPNLQERVVTLRARLDDAQLEAARFRVASLRNELNPQYRVVRTALSELKQHIRNTRWLPEIEQLLQTLQHDEYAWLIKQARTELSQGDYVQALEDTNRARDLANTQEHRSECSDLELRINVQLALERVAKHADDGKIVQARVELQQARSTFQPVPDKGLEQQFAALEKDIERADQQRAAEQFKQQSLDKINEALLRFEYDTADNLIEHMRSALHARDVSRTDSAFSELDGLAQRVQAGRKLRKQAEELRIAAEALFKEGKGRKAEEAIQAFFTACDGPFFGDPQIQQLRRQVEELQRQIDARIDKYIELAKSHGRDRGERDLKQLEEFYPEHKKAVALRQQWKESGVEYWLGIEDELYATQQKEVRAIQEQFWHGARGQRSKAIERARQLPIQEIAFPDSLHEAGRLAKSVEPPSQQQRYQEVIDLRIARRQLLLFQAALYSIDGSSNGGSIEASLSDKHQPFPNIDGAVQIQQERQAFLKLQEAQQALESANPRLARVRLDEAEQYYPRTRRLADLRADVDIVDDLLRRIEEAEQQLQKLSGTTYDHALMKQVYNCLKLVGQRLESNEHVRRFVEPHSGQIAVDYHSYWDNQTKKILAASERAGKLRQRDAATVEQLNSLEELAPDWIESQLVSRLRRQALLERTREYILAGRLRKAEDCLAEAERYFKPLADDRSLGYERDDIKTRRDKLEQSFAQANNRFKEAKLSVALSTLIGAMEIDSEDQRLEKLQQRINRDMQDASDRASHAEDLEEQGRFDEAEQEWSKAAKLHSDGQYTGRQQVTKSFVTWHSEAKQRHRELVERRFVEHFSDFLQLVAKLRFIHPTYEQEIKDRHEQLQKDFESLKQLVVAAQSDGRPQAIELLYQYCMAHSNYEKWFDKPTSTYDRREQLFTNARKVEASYKEIVHFGQRNRQQLELPAQVSRLYGQFKPFEALYRPRPEWKEWRSNAPRRLPEMIRELGRPEWGQLAPENITKIVTANEYRSELAEIYKPLSDEWQRLLGTERDRNSHNQSLPLERRIAEEQNLFRAALALLPLAHQHATVANQLDKLSGQESRAGSPPTIEDGFQALQQGNWVRALDLLARCTGDPLLVGNTILLLRQAAADQQTQALNDWLVRRSGHDRQSNQQIRQVYLDPIWRIGTEQHREVVNQANQLVVDRWRIRWLGVLLRFMLVIAVVLAIGYVVNRRFNVPGSLRVDQIDSSAGSTYDQTAVVYVEPPLSQPIEILVHGRRLDQVSSASLVANNGQTIELTIVSHDPSALKLEMEEPPESDEDVLYALQLNDQKQRDWTVRVIGVPQAAKTVRGVKQESTIVFAKPGRSSDGIGRVRNGDRFELLEERDGWYEIRIRRSDDPAMIGLTGWVEQRLIDDEDVTPPRTEPQQ